MYRYTYS
ncbi:unnamed protein product, partial [Allacma fusca]